jgi:hypothetical protein
MRKTVLGKTGAEVSTVKPGYVVLRQQQETDMAPK